MPYDPQWPQNGQNIDADRFRAQFGGLKDLIDAVPVITGAQVDAVNTLPAGDAATVDVTFDGTDVHFTFGLPQGNDGSVGADGSQGPAGPPGEVTGAELADAIADTVAGSSANSNAVDTLGSSATPDYDQWLIQAMIDKMNELILALRRP
jgi:hypothetical protein